MSSVRLQFAHGAVRVVPLFGSNGSAGTVAASVPGKTVPTKGVPSRKSLPSSSQRTLLRALPPKKHSQQPFLEGVLSHDSLGVHLV